MFNWGRKISNMLNDKKISVCFLLLLSVCIFFKPIHALAYYQYTKLTPNCDHGLAGTAIGGDGTVMFQCGLLPDETIVFLFKDGVYKELLPPGMNHSNFPGSGDLLSDTGDALLWASNSDNGDGGLFLYSKGNYTKLTPNCDHGLAGTAIGGDGTVMMQCGVLIDESVVFLFKDGVYKELLPPGMNHSYLPGREDLLSDTGDALLWASNSDNGDGGLFLASPQVNPPNSITIISDSQPDSPTHFSFFSNLGSFTLMDSGSVVNQKTFENLSPGTYWFGEFVPPGWTLTDISCQGSASFSPNIDIAGVTINLETDQYLVCHFINSENAPSALGNISLYPFSHNFGEVKKGACSTPVEFTIGNSGNADLQISHIVGGNSDFHLDVHGGSNPCNINNPLINPNRICTFTVTFCPSRSESYSSYIAVISDEPNIVKYVPITGSTKTTTQGYVVIIDGVQIITILYGKYFGEILDDIGDLGIFNTYEPYIFSQYLMDAIKAIDSNWGKTIESKVGKLVPFVWSRNYYDTGTSLDYLSDALKMFSDRCKETDTPLVILSHSWGTVLSYMALAKNHDIMVHKWITLGSPLNSWIPPITEFAEASLNLWGDGITLGNMPNVKEWHNYWAWCDYISGPIVQANQNTMIETNYCDFTQYYAPNPIMCHSAYFKDHGVWSQILLDVINTSKKMK